MWLFVPMNFGPSPSVPELEASTSEYESLGDTDSDRTLGPFVTSSVKPTRRPLSWRGWKMRPWISLLSGMTLPPSMLLRGVERWISGLEGRHASPLVPPDSASENSTIETSGESYGANSESQEPTCSSSRMSVGSVATRMGLLESCATLPPSGCLVSGVVFRMPDWAPLISEKDYSGSSSTPKESTCSERRNWATPITPGGGRKVPPGTSPTGQTPDGKKVTIDLNHQVNGWEFQPSGPQAWPTPSAVSYGSNKGGASGREGQPVRPSLQSLGRDFQVHWPTPKAWDSRSGSGQESRKDQNLSTIMHNDQVFGRRDNLQKHGQDGLSTSGPVVQTQSKRGQAPKRHLNVQFVEVLMGFPVGYSLPTAPDRTAYEDWETLLVPLLGQWLGLCSVVEPLMDSKEVAAWDPQVTKKNS